MRGSPNASAWPKHITFALRANISRAQSAHITSRRCRDISLKKRRPRRFFLSLTSPNASAWPKHITFALRANISRREAAYHVSPPAKHITQKAPPSALFSLSHPTLRHGRSISRLPCGQTYHAANGRISRHGKAVTYHSKSAALGAFFPLSPNASATPKHITFAPRANISRREAAYHVSPPAKHITEKEQTCVCSFSLLLRLRHRYRLIAVEEGCRPRLAGGSTVAKHQRFKLPIARRCRQRQR